MEENKEKTTSDSDNKKAKDTEIIKHGQDGKNLEIRPRSRSRTSNPREVVDLAIGTGKLQDLEPITVGQLFRQTVRLIPDNVAMKYKQNDEWRTIYYRQYYEMVIKAAKSFIKVRTILIPRL